MSNSFTCKLVESLSHYDTPEHGMGNPHTASLQMFYDAVVKAIPNSFLVWKNTTHAWVCHKRDPLTLGYVGYADYSGGHKYGVFARSIENGRFSSGSEYRYLLASADTKVALRNARTHLRVHNMDEVAAATFQPLKAELSSLNSEYSNLRSRGEAVFRSEAFKFEIRHLLENQHTFLNPTVEADLRVYFNALDAENKVRQVERVLYCACIKEDWRGQVLNLKRMDNTTASKIWSLRPDSTSPSSEHVVSEIQPDTMEHAALGRVGVLNMVQPNKYLDGVGMKLAESVYYVEL